MYVTSYWSIKWLLFLITFGSVHSFSCSANIYWVPTMSQICSMHWEYTKQKQTKILKIHRLKDQWVGQKNKTVNEVYSVSYNVKCWGEKCSRGKEWGMLGSTVGI